MKKGNDFILYINSFISIDEIMFNISFVSSKNLKLICNNPYYDMP